MARLLVQDDSLLPELRTTGASDAALNRIKQDLENHGFLTNHRVIGGFADFTWAAVCFSTTPRSESRPKYYKKGSSSLMTGSVKVRPTDHLLPTTLARS